jgi:hypothetical protein
MHKHRCISASLFALALAGCQGRGLQPQSTSAATPSTNDTIATVTSEPARAEEQSSTTVETTSTTAEIIPETVPVTRVRATVPATTARTAPATTTPAETPATGDVWWALALCESGGANVDTGNGYSGYFQFLDSTWRSVGYSGRAVDHGYETQRAGAQTLQSRSGWGQWPACSRKLGLR